MNEKRIPVPDFLPTLFEKPPADLAEQILELYRRLAENARLVKRTIEQARKEREAQRRESDRVIALLASERFELRRLMDRILPAMEGAELDKEAKALSLFARRWDENLRRLRIEVQDPVEQTLSDELTEVLEVESAVSDRSVTEVLVRETLFPIVRFEDRLVGIGKVIASVPCVQQQPEEEENKEGS